MEPGFRNTHFPFETTHFIIIEIGGSLNKTIFNFHSLKFLKALPLTPLLSWISNKEVLFIFSTNKVAAEEIPQ